MFTETRGLNRNRTGEDGDMSFGGRSGYLLRDEETEGGIKDSPVFLACAHGVKVALFVKMRMEGPRRKGVGRNHSVLNMLERRCPFDV